MEEIKTNKYRFPEMKNRTQKQFDEIVDSVINGNFNQAVDFVIEYGFYAQDLRKIISHTFVECTLWKNEDFYQVIETATKKRCYHNVKEAAKRLAQSALDDWCNTNIFYLCNYNMHTGFDSLADYIFIR